MGLDEPTKVYIQAEVSRVADEKGLDALRDKVERFWGELEEAREKIKKLEEHNDRLEYEIRQVRLRHP